MRLFRNGKRIDFKKRTEDVGRAYGCKHPEKISGFAGCFLRGEPYIYVSDKLEAYLLEDPKFSAELMKLVEKYNKDDFGVMSKAESDNQLENIHFFGNTSWNKGIYETGIGIVVYEVCYDDALLYLDDEQNQAGQFRTAQVNKKDEINRRNSLD